MIKRPFGTQLSAIFGPCVVFACILGTGYVLLIVESQDAFLSAIAASVVATGLSWTMVRSNPVARTVLHSCIWHAGLWALAGFLSAVVFVSLESNSDMRLGFYLLGLFAGGLAGAVYGSFMVSQTATAVPSRRRGGRAGALSALGVWAAIMSVSLTAPGGRARLPITVLLQVGLHMLVVGTVLGILFHTKGSPADS